jgi:hypothetical protein
MLHIYQELQKEHKFALESVNVLYKQRLQDAKNEILELSKDHWRLVDNAERYDCISSIVYQEIDYFSSSKYFYIYNDYLKTIGEPYAFDITNFFNLDIDNINEMLGTQNENTQKIIYKCAEYEIHLGDKILECKHYLNLNLLNNHVQLPISKSCLKYLLLKIKQYYDSKFVDNLF